MQFTADEIFKLIEEKFSGDDIVEMFDDEVLNWVDSDWEDEYDSEYDWYIDHNNKEAEDVVFDNLLTAIGNFEYSNFEEGEYERLKELVSDYADLSF